MEGERQRGKRGKGRAREKDVAAVCNCGEFRPLLPNRGVETIKNTIDCYWHELLLIVSQWNSLVHKFNDWY